MKIVPDRFEFGIEKEYAIVYKERDFISYLLASQQIINKIKSMTDIHENLVKKWVICLAKAGRYILNIPML